MTVIKQTSSLPSYDGSRSGLSRLRHLLGENTSVQLFKQCATLIEQKKAEELTKLVNAQDSATKRRLFVEAVERGALQLAKVVKVLHKDPENPIVVREYDIVESFKYKNGLRAWLIQQVDQSTKERAAATAISRQKWDAYEALSSEVEITCLDGALLFAASGSAQPQFIETIIEHFSAEDRATALAYAASDVATLQTLLKHQLPPENTAENTHYQYGVNYALFRAVDENARDVMDLLLPLANTTEVYNKLKDMSPQRAEDFLVYCSEKQKSLLVDKIKTARDASVTLDTPARKI